MEVASRDIWGQYRAELSRYCPFKWKAGVYLMQGHAGPAVSHLMVILMKRVHNNWVL